MSIEIYIARHASPDWTRTDLRYDVPPGPPLTARGEQEARALGQFLKQRDVVRIYGSPMLRASSTANLAAEVLGLSAVIDPSISEWTKEETGREVSDRLRPFWEQLCNESAQAGPICLVTHGGPMGMLLYQRGLSEEMLASNNGPFDHGTPSPASGAWRVAGEHSEGPWTLDLCFEPPRNEANY